MNRGLYVRVLDLIDELKDTKSEKLETVAQIYTHDGKYIFKYSIEKMPDPKELLEKLNGEKNVQ